MLNGYRRIILAIVGLAFVVAGLTVTYQLYDASEQHKAGYNYQPARQPRFDKPAQGQAIAQSYQPYCQNPDTKEDADLCAQWAAVEQTTESNRLSSLNLRFAMASLWATVFATGLLLWTLVETRGTSRRELRAYLFVHISTLLIGSGKHNLGKIVSVAAVKNSGATPAHQVRHYGAVEIAPIEDEGRMKAPDKLEQGNQNTIPPGGEITADRFVMQKPTRTEIAAIKKAESAIFLYGAIEYFDVFGREHRTDYRLYYVGPWPLPENPLMRFCTEGNTAT